MEIRGTSLHCKFVHEMNTSDIKLKNRLQNFFHMSEIKIPVKSSARLQSQAFKEFEDDGNSKEISDLFGTRI